MSGRSSIEPAMAATQARAPAWHVRGAIAEDVPLLASAVRELLLELGGTPASASEIELAAHALLEDPRCGALLVARAGAEIVGVLGASWQCALHIPGRYALIQDLWVHPRWRGKTIGRDLLAAVSQLALELGISRIEVGLPQERFAGLEATEAFYLDNGFTPLGIRMRRLLS